MLRSWTDGWMPAMGVLVLVGSSWVSAQTSESLPPPVASELISLSEREQLWLDQRESQLTAQIRHLERIESTLGQRHPSMPEVKAELEALRSQLSTWQPEINEGTSVSAADALDDLSASQLRKLILQMAIKVDRLETRLGVVERRMRQL